MLAEKEVGKEEERDAPLLLHKLLLHVLQLLLHEQELDKSMVLTLPFSAFTYNIR